MHAAAAPADGSFNGTLFKVKFVFFAFRANGGRRKGSVASVKQSDRCEYILLLETVLVTRMNERDSA
jgi:hypothetical protein